MAADRTRTQVLMSSAWSPVNTGMSSWISRMRLRWPLRARMTSFHLRKNLSWSTGLSVQLQNMLLRR